MFVKIVEISGYLESIFRRFSDRFDKITVCSVEAMKYDSESFEKLELICADFKVLFVNDIFSFES